jgi:hypothetical protein
MSSVKNVVAVLAEKYGFDAVEGLRWVGGGKSDVNVPFVKKVEGWCDGLKNNKGLFNQCMNKPVKGESLCRGCKKQAEKHGKPTYGLASEREAEGELWRSPKGRKPIHYGNYFVKEKLDEETVIEEMKRIYGMSEVSDEFFTPKKSNRGRPKKAKAEIQDTDDEGEKAPAPVKKPRGRPKKENKTVVAEVETGSDLIETLITRAKSDEASAPVEAPAKKTKKTAAEKEAEKEAKKAAKEAEKAAKKAAKEAEKEAKKAAKEAKKAEPVVDEEEAAVIPTEDAVDEEEDHMEVDVVEINGVKYLIDGDQIVYDCKTQQPIGKFNGIEIEECEFEFEE